MFQSLVGFKINWNKGKVIAGEKTEKFQSLVGFKINCNKRIDLSRLVAIACFNP